MGHEKQAWVRSFYAMHPYNASGYNRNRVYPLIGVDSFVTKEEFVEAKKVRGFGFRMKQTMTR